MNNIRHLGLLTLFVALFAQSVVVAQPGPDKGQTKDQKPKPPIDEFRAIHKEIVEAYKAPGEVDKDVLDELRKQYRDPKPDREAKIFREIRRLYATTAELEEAILHELRRAYESQSYEQEERVFALIRRGGQLPLGTVPGHIMVDQATKLFRKLDQNSDGFMEPDEMPDGLFNQFGKWDQNGDRAISLEEYVRYYQTYLNWIGAGVASGEIPLKLPKPGEAETIPVPTPVEQSRPTPAKVEKQLVPLPEWFAQFDKNSDGQVGLYEWKAAGRKVAEFLTMDRNGDGFLEPDEVHQSLAEQRSSNTNSGSSSRSLGGR